MGERLKALWANIKAQIASLWDKDRAIIIAGILITLFMKYRDILISILINSANRVKTNADKKDQQLSEQENQANTAANQAIVDAQNEPSKEKPVSDDWYKKGN